MAIWKREGDHNQSVELLEANIPDPRQRQVFGRLKTSKTWDGIKDPATYQKHMNYEMSVSGTTEKKFRKRKVEVTCISKHYR